MVKKKEEKKVLHFAEITELEKRLLNIYRKFYDDETIEYLVESLIDDVTSTMVDHTVEQWALEEVLEKGKEHPNPYDLFVGIKTDSYNLQENQDTLEKIEGDMREEVVKVVYGDLAELPSM